MAGSVLVVEDSPTQAERLRVLLEDEGYRVTVSNNGREGLERVRADLPDLVISDVLMPELDGFSFCQAVKSDEVTRRIPIVLLTTENSPLDVIIGLERGADNFITKPYDPQYLLETVAQILKDRRLRQEGKLPDRVLHVGNRQVSVPGDRQQIIELLAALTMRTDSGQTVESQSLTVEYTAQIGQLDRIRDALDQDRLVLYYQPILDIRRGSITQHEVLVRMVAEDGKIIPPSDFLPAAEHSGLISRIDLTVLQKAIDLLHEQHRLGQAMKLSVNISSKSLLRPSVVERLADALVVMEVDPSVITLEITESSFITNMRHATDSIHLLQERGCKVALDDFGVGYSTVDYLKQLPVDVVKIDGAFVRDLARTETDQKLVEGMTRMAHDLGKQVVAEFVGDAETLAYLRQFQVDFAQGYFIGRPAPVPVFRAP
ncbi:MAG: EAL domain-containing response regulator [Thermaerobacter sp.]|nr:EAL domain-containing response regulator [Thermaerobacter sp.]